MTRVENAHAQGTRCVIHERRVNGEAFPLDRSLLMSDPIL